MNKSFDEPDEPVTQPLLTVQVVLIGEVYVARMVHQPGWSWSEHVQPVAGTATCLHHHQGVVLSGQVEIEMEEGARRIMRAGEAFDITPGHLSRVVGNEPYVCIEFAGVRGWAKSPEAGERVVATLLVTDIVGSRTWLCGSATLRGRSFSPAMAMACGVSSTASGGWR